MQHARKQSWDVRQTRTWMSTCNSCCCPVDNVRTIKSDFKRELGSFHWFVLWCYMVWCICRKSRSEWFIDYPFYQQFWSCPLLELINKRSFPVPFLSQEPIMLGEGRRIAAGALLLLLGVWIAVAAGSKGCDSAKRSRTPRNGTANSTAKARTKRSHCFGRSPILWAQYISLVRPIDVCKVSFYYY